MGTHCTEDFAASCVQHSTSVAAWWYTCRKGSGLPRRHSSTVSLSSRYLVM